jgi:hypothetical protein
MISLLYFEICLTLYIMTVCQWFFVKKIKKESSQSLELTRSGRRDACTLYTGICREVVLSG